MGNNKSNENNYEHDSEHDSEHDYEHDSEYDSKNNFKSDKGSIFFRTDGSKKIHIDQCCQALYDRSHEFIYMPPHIIDTLNTNLFCKQCNGSYINKTNVYKTDTGKFHYEKTCRFATDSTCYELDDKQLKTFEQMDYLCSVCKK